MAAPGACAPQDSTVSCEKLRRCARGRRLILPGGGGAGLQPGGHTDRALRDRAIVQTQKSPCRQHVNKTTMVHYGWGWLGAGGSMVAQSGQEGRAQAPSCRVPQHREPQQSANMPT